MSKNFELLYQMGKAQGMLQPDVLPAAEVAPLPEPPVAAVPTLEIEGPAREELTKLVHRLFLLPGSEAPHQVVFSGTEAGNGCSWMCAHVAEILASQLGSSICIVDSNFQEASLHTQFKANNGFGLVEALTGDNPIREYTQRLSRSNLFLLTTGAVNAGSEKLLTSARMRARISELRSEFDFVLIDVPPINTSNQALILGSSADGVVLVLKANSTRRDSTRDAIQQLQSSNVRLLGAVLNQRTFPIPERIYKHL